MYYHCENKRWCAAQGEKRKEVLRCGFNLCSFKPWLAGYPSHRTYMSCKQALSNKLHIGCNRRRHLPKLCAGRFNDFNQIFLNDAQWSFIGFSVLFLELEHGSSRSYCTVFCVATTRRHETRDLSPEVKSGEVLMRFPPVTIPCMQHPLIS